ncbi:hypothetical protein HMPREF0970_01693 [Schaalia odontolytica F0309]|uniref:Uncharacterized protein n=1 Tax=Schaalia odontolytica F0309 TaxID=649742 RepID=D4U0F1_9ACTO|nr:hypothetical protein HMPREF0970_01693 [Schaalia odontolytica F0309]
MSYVRQKHDARDDQFRSSRARFFSIHRGLTSHCGAAPRAPQPAANTARPRPETRPRPR